MRYLYLLATVIDTSGLPNHKPSGTINKVLGIVFGIAASISLLMIVISGLRYILAKGDPNGTAQAKNGIIYAVVGLVITMAAYSIVTFVIKGVG